MVPISLLGRIALAGSLILLPAMARPQGGLTLQEAQRLAVARSQQIVAQDAAAGAARELAVAAGQRPDPVLRIGVDNVPISGADRFSLARDSMTMRRIGLMQELPRAEKRRLKVEQVERDLQRIAAERALALASVQRATALAWIDVHYTQAMVLLLQRQVQETQLQEQGAALAYRSSGSQADVFAARAALAQQRDKLAQAQRQLASARLMLSRWVGPEAGGTQTSGAADWRSSVRAERIAGALRDLPQLQQAAAQVALAETELRRADANTRADWTIEAMVAQRGPGYAAMASIGLSIPLQIDRRSRQDREVAARRASLAEAESRYLDTLAEQQAEVHILLNDWRGNRDRLAHLAADLLPAAEQRTQAALTAYATGKGDLAASLAARRDETDARLQLLALEMETAQLWARLNYLVADESALPAHKEQP